MSEPISVFLTDRAVLRVEGADAETFLQGLISNDIEKLKEDRAIYAALLTPQGKYLFDFLLYRRGETIFLDTEAARVEALIARLSMYRLRARVTIEQGSELAVVAVVGSGAINAFGLAEQAGAALVTPDCLAIVDPRHSDLGVRLIGRREMVERAAQQAGITEGDFDTYDQRRICLTIPDGTRDLIEQKSTLLESNFEAINGVDFDKGCFVGQELTARTKHRGLVKKRLMPITIEGELPTEGAPILADGKEVGEVRSHCNNVGLALMRLNRLDEGHSHAMMAGDARIRLRES